MLVNLRALFGSLIDIVLLRRGPETLPASTALLAIVVAINAAVGAIVVAFIPTIPAITVPELIVNSLVPLLWFWMAFSLAKKPERFVQTMTAVFGVNMMFQPFISPMFAALLPYIQKPDPNVPPPAVLSLLFLLITVWLTVVWVRIVHAAFEWPYLVCFVFVLAGNMATLFIMAALFGGSPAQA